MIWVCVCTMLVLDTHPEKLDTQGRVLSVDSRSCRFRTFVIGVSPVEGVKVGFEVGESFERARSGASSFAVAEW